jgi:hypothetical protein
LPAADDVIAGAAEQVVVAVVAADEVVALATEHGIRAATAAQAVAARQSDEVVVAPEGDEGIVLGATGPDLRHRLAGLRDPAAAA